MCLFYSRLCCLGCVCPTTACCHCMDMDFPKAACAALGRVCLQKIYKRFRSPEHY
jgi:hypothetical protein